MQRIVTNNTNQFGPYYSGTVARKHNTELQIHDKMRYDKMNEVALASFVSHEFGTPLSCILSSASLIAMYSGADQQNERERHVQRIVTSVHDLNEILNEFLSVMQLEKETINSSLVKFNLPDYLNEVIDQLHGLVSIKHQAIRYRHKGKKVIGQSKKILKHILLNLLSNASKYSKENEVIYLYSSVAGGALTLTVKDNGIGIPDGDQNKLFTEFFRATNVKEIHGTGLGLTIVKKYVELLNGTITFFSKTNEGTEFKITIPQNFQR